MATELEYKKTRGRPRTTGLDQPAAPVQALDRALVLLRELARTDSANLTELSQRTNVAPSTTHRLLTTMQAHGVAEFDETSQNWMIGVEAFRIGSSFVRRTRIVEAGRAIMRTLMETSGETANMAIVDGGDVVFISQVETHQPIRAFFRPGERGPIHASGIGKALLAEYSDEAVERIADGNGLPAFTDKTLSGLEDLIRDLEEIRQRGWSLDDEERNLGMRCIAAAIYNEHGEAVAGVSVSGPTVRIPDERIGELGPQVKQAAAEITRSIGGVPPTGRT